MRMSYLLFLCTVLPVMAQGERFSFGVTGGVPAQTPQTLPSNEVPFVIGPTLNVKLFSHLSIETGVLFNRMGHGESTSAFRFPENAVTVVFNSQRVRAIEVPILGKYRFRGEQQLWRPFVTLGPTIRHTSVDANYASTILSGTQLDPTTAQPTFNRKRVDWSVDPTVGAG